MMKRLSQKILAGIVLIGLSLGLTSCSGGSATKDNNSETLKVGMECAYAPYNWTQKDDSNGAVQIEGSYDYANGYDVMIAKKLAEALNKKLVIVKTDWDSLVPAVQSGILDCAIAGQSITSDRLKNVDFTKPYYEASIVTLTKKDSSFANAKGLTDLKKAKATSQLNTVWYDLCIPQIPDVEKLTAADSAPAMLLALESGTVDIVVTDQPTALSALQAYPDFTVLDFQDSNDDYQVTKEEIEIGISLQKNNNDLKDAMNKVLSEMNSEDFKTLMNEAIKIQPLGSQE